MSSNNQEYFRLYYLQQFVIWLNLIGYLCADDIPVASLAIVYLLCEPKSNGVRINW